jgi:hypothetical protein
VLKLYVQIKLEGNCEDNWFNFTFMFTFCINRPKLRLFYLFYIVVILDITGQSYTLFTPDTAVEPEAIENHGWFYAVGKSFIFQLQTCLQAEIVLAVTPFSATTDGYSVKLGDVSWITRLFNSEVASIDTPGLLDCYALRTFWITWYDGIVRLGHGKMNSNKLLEFPDTSHLAIAALSLQTSGSPGGGQWQVTKSSGTTKSAAFGDCFY